MAHHDDFYDARDCKAMDIVRVGVIGVKACFDIDALAYFAAKTNSYFMYTFFVG
jgi:hypothetical protein